MNTRGLPQAPVQVPQRPLGIGAQICRWVLWRSGWQLLGELPNEPKLVVIGAPHSSYWDAVWGLLMKIGIGLDLGIMIKREVVAGPLGLILRPLGAIPIDRGAATDVVGQMVQRFGRQERMWLGITPEGTRKRVTRWKSGFLRIARGARVPIMPVFIDYPSKTFTLGPLFHPSDDAQADMAALRAMFAPYRGKHRGTL